MNFHCRKLNSLVSVQPPTTARPGVRFTACPFAFLATKVLSRVVLMCRAIPWMASSQEISSQWSDPGRRTLGVRIRFGLSMSYLSVAPFGHSVPRLVGASGSPSTCTTVDLTFFALSPSVWTMTPHATAQYGQMLRVSVVRAILSCRISARACEMSNPIPTAAPAAAARFKNVRRFIEPPPRFDQTHPGSLSRSMPASIRPNQGVPSPDRPQALPGLGTGLSGIRSTLSLTGPALFLALRIGCATCPTDCDPTGSHPAPTKVGQMSTRPVLVGPLLRRRGPRAERAPRVAEGTVRPGQRTLASELLRSLCPVDVARERGHECDEVFELAFLEPERLDVLIEPGVLRAGSLVVVVEDVPERLVRPVVEVRSGDQDVPQARRLERRDVGLLLGDEKAAQRAHVGPDRRPVHIGRVAGIDQLLRLPRERDHVMADDEDADVVEVVVLEVGQIGRLVGKRVALVAAGPIVEERPPALGGVVDRSLVAGEEAVERRIE